MKEFDDFDMTVTCEEVYTEDEYNSFYEGLHEWEEELFIDYPEPEGLMDYSLSPEQEAAIDMLFAMSL